MEKMRAKKSSKKEPGAESLLPPKRTASPFWRVADALRQEAFSRPPGELLGGEDELIARFGVSRPTFRQAAKLIEQEQLIRIKRGVGGGYFVNRPDSNAVTHITAIYLRTHKATLAHIVAAVRPLFVSTARLAAQSPSSELRGRLQLFLNEDLENLHKPISILDYVRRDKKFTLLFAETSGNPLIRLFIDIVIDLTSMIGESIWINHPGRMKESQFLRVQLMEAILANDIELAEIAARRMTEKTAIWTLENTGDKSAVHLTTSKSDSQITNVARGRVAP